MNCPECKLSETCQVKYLYEIDIIGYRIAELLCEIIVENELSKVEE